MSKDFWIGLTALAVFTVLGSFIGCKVQKDKDEPVQEQLEYQIDSLNDVITKLNLRYDTLWYDRLLIDNEIYILQNKITQLQDEYKTKVITIRTYTKSELDSFFAKRYPDCN